MTELAVVSRNTSLPRIPRTFSRTEILSIAAQIMGPAVLAQQEARHYANFMVGAVGFVLDGEKKPHVVLRGANTKLTQDAIKDCAEQSIFRQAKAQLQRLDGVAVVGNPRPEDLDYTLHPCGEHCRREIRALILENEILHEDSLIICITVKRTRIIVEDYTAAGLLEHHGEPWRVH